MSSTGNFISKLAFVLIVVIILSIIVGPWLRSTPIVEVTDCSLTSDTITNNGLTTITITLKNNDENNAHTIRVEFSSHPLVSFMLGSQLLSKEDDVWYYTENLNPSASHTQSIKVKATLETGIAEISYRITINFSKNGEHFDDKKFDLRVRRP